MNNQGLGQVKVNDMRQHSIFVNFNSFNSRNQVCLVAKQNIFIFPLSFTQAKLNDHMQPMPIKSVFYHFLSVLVCVFNS